jgi:hypothetical protein
MTYLVDQSASIIAGLQGVVDDLAARRRRPFGQGYSRIAAIVDAPPRL